MSCSTQYDPDAERDVWSRPRSKGDDSELSVRQEAERRVEQNWGGKEEKGRGEMGGKKKGKRRKKRGGGKGGVVANACSPVRRPGAFYIVLSIGISSKMW